MHSALLLGQSQACEREEEGMALHSLSWLRWASGVSAEVPAVAGPTVPGGLSEMKIEVLQACLLSGFPAQPPPFLHPRPCLRLSVVPRAPEITLA